MYGNEKNELPEAEVRRIPTVAVAAAVTIVAFALLFFSICRLMPLVWDEGFSYYRTAKSAEWAEKVFAGDSWASLFSLDVLTESWEGSRTLEGHPSFPMILITMGRILPEFVSIAVQLRFFVILFFALALGGVAYRLAADYGTATAVFGTASILLIPRVFAHAQVAAWDSTLAASWLLAWATFFPALKSHRGAALFGLCVGLTAASKFPGLGVVFPPLIWLAIRCSADRRLPPEKRLNLRDLSIRAGITTVVALLVFWLLNPPLWVDPIGGIREYIHLNTNREIDIAFLFFGEFYSMYRSLPWYNTIAWTLVTVPVGLLLLAAIGFVTSILRPELRWSGLFLFLNMSVMLVFRALPGTPVHDGIRLFLPAFPFLAIFAGIGAATLWQFPLKRKLMSRILVAGIYAACIFNMFWYAPQWLSFYNLAIGGLPGAARAGMEVTYFFDSVDREMIEWLNTHAEPGEKVVFYPKTSQFFGFYRKNDFLRIPCAEAHVELTFDELMQLYDRDRYRFFVMQRRSSCYRENFAARMKPLFVKTIRKGGWGPWNLGSVPIAEVFDLKPPEDNKP